MRQLRRTLSIDLEPRIYTVRELKIILDTDLARLYGVSVKRLNEQVKRNKERFPADFMFQLSRREDRILRSQIATSKDSAGGRRYLAYAFTEHGAVMAATVLNSELAVRMSVHVVRAFVQLRETLARNREISVKIQELEAHLETHDEVILDLFRAIKRLANPRTTRKRTIGFQVPDPGAQSRTEKYKFLTLPTIRRLSAG